MAKLKALQKPTSSEILLKHHSPALPVMPSNYPLFCGSWGSVGVFQEVRECGRRWELGGGGTGRALKEDGGEEAGVECVYRPAAARFLSQWGYSSRRKPFSRGRWRSMVHPDVMLAPGGQGWHLGGRGGTHD